MRLAHRFAQVKLQTVCALWWIEHSHHLQNFDLCLANSRKRFSAVLQSSVDRVFSVDDNTLNTTHTKCNAFARVARL